MRYLTNHIKLMIYKYFFLIYIILLVPGNVLSQQKLVKILVASPYVKADDYQPLADVVAGCIIRELKREGGLEIIDREIAEEYIKGQGGTGWIANRVQAIKVGEALDADIVIYTTIQVSYDNFIYRIIFFEVERDLIQRALKGAFHNSTSASEIGRIMKKEVEKLKRYIPLPSELADPGLLIRDTTIDPDKLSKSHEIENFPPFGRFGVIEQVFTYYRVFPGELEYRKFEQGTTVMRFSLRDNMDEELTTRYNLYNSYADFAIRHNLQAFLIKDCSTQAINVLAANNIPVFYTEELILGYDNLLSDGYCWFKTLSNAVFDTTEMTHRNRILVLIIVPKPGKKGGISKEYIESAIGRYKNEWSKSPTLVEVKEGMLDIISSEFE